MPSRRALASAPLLFALALALLALCPSIIRSTHLYEISYNEGWNINNASALAQHRVLYPAGYHWTTNNYPALSFLLAAALHPLTHDYLFTARTLSVLSLFALSALVGLILRNLGLNPPACILAALFCLGVFPASTAHTDYAPYIGVDDPQMLALAAFFTGLWLYTRIRSKPSLPGLFLLAAVFTIAGCIKHNSISVPLAVLLDLTLLHWKRALWFAFSLAICIAAAIAAHRHWAGPGFLTNLLLPRIYVAGRAWQLLQDFYLPLLPPILLALFAAARSPRLRLLWILSVISLLTGVWFASAQGVSTNAFFESLLALVLWIGVFCNHIATLRPAPRLQALLTALPALSLLVPLILYHDWNPVAALRSSRQSQDGFAADVAFLRAHPGPALCESMLRCAYAGKPFLYDPFNATRLIRLHLLDQRPLLDQIDHHAFSTIEMRESLDLETRYTTERFQPSVLLEISRNYHLAYQRNAESIYLPNTPQRPLTNPSHNPGTPTLHASATTQVPRPFRVGSHSPSKKEGGL